MDFGVPGWEAELVYDEAYESDIVKVRLQARRTAEGPWTETDQWMLEHGQAYLDDVLKRVHSKFTLGPS